MNKNLGVEHSKYEQRKHEIQMANYALKTNINKLLTQREKQKFDVDVRLNQSKEEYKQIMKNMHMYEEIVLERRRFLTYQYMHRNPNDVEEMVKALYSQFENIRKTCFSAMAKENYTGGGSFDLITESNKQLRMLEKELKSFTIQKDDLRFTLYSMIMVMLQDNIQMRLWINDLMQNQVEESQRSLDAHAKYQDDVSASQSMIKRQDTDHSRRSGKRRDDNDLDDYPPVVEFSERDYK